MRRLTIPAQKSIELPLLKTINDAGGELRIGEAVKLVALLFPQLTSEDLQRKVPSGTQNYWTNWVQWVRQKLVSSGELDKSTRGVWRITEKGRLRVQREMPAGTSFAVAEEMSKRTQETIQPKRSEGVVGDETELYSPVLKWVKETWGADVGKEGIDFWARKTASQARRGLPGKWSRPDLTFIQVSRFDVLPQRGVEISTLEVKRFSEATNIASVYEAVSHQRWAHKSYVVVEVPDSSRGLPDSLTSEAGRFGVGLLKVYRSQTGYEVEDVLGATRQNPEPAQMDRMLSDYFLYDYNELKRFKDAIK